MTRRQQRSLKILFAYALWLCDFIVWSNGWTDSFAPRSETGMALLIYLIGLLLATILS